MRVGPRIGVLTGAGRGLPAAVALAKGLARGRRCSTATVLVRGDVTWPSGPLAPGRPGARRLAASAAETGVPAVAAGRLVVGVIDDDTIVASAQIQRVAQLAGTAPLVVATERPRDADVDAVLAFADALVVVVPQDATPALVALACDGEPRPTRVVRTDITATVGTLALSGVPVLPALRRLGAELATEA